MSFSANGMFCLPALSARWLTGLLLLSTSLVVVASQPQDADKDQPTSPSVQPGQGYSLSEILERLRETRTPGSSIEDGQTQPEGSDSVLGPVAEDGVLTAPVATQSASAASASVSDDAASASTERPAASAGPRPGQADQSVAVETPETSSRPVELPVATPAIRPEPLAAPIESPVPAVAVVATATISGRIRLSAGDRPLRASEASNAIVYFRPAVPVTVEPLSEEQVMATRRKQFVPRALPVTPGTRVRFPNNDPILHNTFSTVPGNEFDTGLYGQGEGIAHTFETTGHVRVYCNVHHSMIGHVLVLDTPFFANPDATGAFRLVNVPVGEGELFVWHERSTLWRQPLDPASGTPLEIDIELSTRRVPQHTNKFGQPYRRRGDSEY